MKARVLTLLLSASGALAQTLPKPVILTISTARSEFAIGEPIKHEISLHNKSDGEISVAHSNAPEGKAELSYDVDVLDSMGRRAPYLPYGKALHGEDPSSAMIDSQRVRKLQSNDALTDTTVLTTIYDLRRPGQYLVQVTKRGKFPGVEPLTPVASKAIKITITSPLR